MVAKWQSYRCPRSHTRRVAQAVYHKRFTMNPRVNPGELSLELALAMINGYTNDAKLAGPFDGDWQLVSVEDRLEIPLTLGSSGLLASSKKGVLSFQSDRVVWNKEQQHLVIVDTKTSARMDRRWSRQWETSLQMKLYMAGAKTAYDIENVSVVVEGVLKSVPTDIRYEVCPSWSVGTLTEAVNQARIIAERDSTLIASETDGVPRDRSAVVKDALINTAVNYQECYSYGVECPFRKLCTAEPEERLGLLNGEYFEIPEADQAY